MVEVYGTDVKKYSLNRLRKKIAVVPQKAVLFSGTIRENMKWGGDNITDEQIWRALKISQAYEFVEKLKTDLIIRYFRAVRTFLAVRSKDLLLQGQ